MKLIFATSNRGKLREAAEILSPEFELASPADFGITDDVEETGDTLKANSILKAQFIHSLTGKDCFADDTGLEVDALGGAPGVRSARYATEGHDFAANRRKLLYELQGIPFRERTARFRCVVTLIYKGEMHFFEGKMEGRISLEECGTKGFGYDPVFIADAFPEQTIAQIGEEIKNRISHRGIALTEMAEWLKTNAK